jgi:Rrf2 family protein
MYLTARVDYALRAGAEIAAAKPGPACAERIARSQGISVKFIEQILAMLKRAGIVCSRRGADGGYWLARPADKITLAEVIRAVDGRLAAVHGDSPAVIHYRGPAKVLRQVWIAVRASLHNVLEEVTLADLVSGKLPLTVSRLARGRGRRSAA